MYSLPRPFPFVHNSYLLSSFFLSFFLFLSFEQNQAKPSINTSLSLLHICILLHLPHHRYRYRHRFTSVVHVELNPIPTTTHTQISSHPTQISKRGKTHHPPLLIPRINHLSHRSNTRNRRFISPPIPTSIPTNTPSPTPTPLSP